MKRPSATRALGKQIHKCGCCGSTEHRIEGCPEPGASKIRALTKKLKDSLEGRPVNHVLRQEKNQKEPEDEWKISTKRAETVSWQSKYSDRDAV